jgi:SAM-dependent methyltransferase
VLDLACGNGRHSRLLVSLGHRVLAVDRDADALAKVAGEGITTLQCDLETEGASEAAELFAPQRYTGIVVTNYLHRPLFPALFSSLAVGGILIYETFARGNELFGKPSNPDYLLAPGELLDAIRSNASKPLRIIAFEDGYVHDPRPAAIQRICAMNAGPEISPEGIHLF